MSILSKDGAHSMLQVQEYEDPWATNLLQPSTVQPKTNTQYSKVSKSPRTSSADDVQADPRGAAGSRPTSKDSERRTSRANLESSLKKISGQMSRRMSTSRKSEIAPEESEPVGIKKPLASKMFMDMEALKEKVKQKLERPRYDVQELYYTTGVIQRVARHWVFEYLTLFIIAFNAIWIAIDTDLNDQEILLNAAPIFQVMENAFCAYFSLELTIRFLAFRNKLNCLKDAWFMFDSFLVMTMVLETWIMSIVLLAVAGAAGANGLSNASILRMLRLLRLSRMARMARLLRAMPELMILIKGMVAAGRSVFFTMCLLCLVHYIFAMIFTQLSANTYSGSIYWPSVYTAMYTLLVNGTLLDNIGQVIFDITNDGWYFAPIFYIFILLSTYMLCNMLIGILCEVVSQVAQIEKEEGQVAFVKMKMMQIFHDSGLDSNGDGEISKDEFMQILTNHEATRALSEVEVDPVGLVDFADFIFESDDTQEETKLSFGEFMDVILELRGSNTATVKDMMDLRKFIRKAGAKMNYRLQRIEAAQVAALKARKLASQTAPGDPSPPSSGSGIPGLQSVAESAPTAQNAVTAAPRSQQQNAAASQKHMQTPGTTQYEATNNNDPELQAWLAWCEQNLVARHIELQHLLQGVSSLGGSELPGVVEHGSENKLFFASRSNDVAARMARLSQLLGDGLLEVRMQRTANMGDCVIRGETQSDLV